MDVKTYQNYEFNHEKSVNENMSLEKFLEVVTGRNDMIKVFKQFRIDSIHELSRLDEHGWTQLQNHIPAHVEGIRNSVNALQFKTIGNNKIRNSNNESSRAESLHSWHKCLLSLYYYSGSKYDELGYLNQDALKNGFEEQKQNKEFDIGPVLDKIKVALEVYTIPENIKAMRVKSHGMLFYGPPGTGKTHLSNVIIKKSGLEPVVEPLSSAELNRSLVGATEKLLMAIWDRAKRCPQWLCCVAIDEIESLVPKRNDKAAGHKVDALSLLLSLIGGIKDVPNLYVIASTNRLNKIDDAFARRLQDKFYIGKLTNKQRIDLLGQMQNKQVSLLQEHVNIDFCQLQDIMAKLTTNFSGAALASLRSRILSYFDLNQNDKNVNELTKENLIEIAVKVAHDFQIRLGRYSIPQLIQNSGQNDYNELWDKVKDENILSGRILIDLQPNTALIGFEYHNHIIDELLEINLKERFEDVFYVSHMIPIILDFCIQLQVDNIQLIDTDALVSASAFDEASIAELVNEALEEFDKFDNGLIVFDVDTLVGVSESQSGMNDSSSYSVQNQRLWQNILHAFKRSYFNENISKRKWCMFISGSSFLIKQFQNLTAFPKTKTQIIKENEDAEARTKALECINCHCMYLEVDNNINACGYHPGALINISDTNRLPISQNGFLDILRDKKTNEEIERFKKSYFYVCCMEQFHSAGCKRNKHSNTESFIYVNLDYGDWAHC